MTTKIPQPPEGTQLAKGVVHRDITNIPDVWRHLALPEVEVTVSAKVTEAETA